MLTEDVEEESQILLRNASIALGFNHFIFLDLTGGSRLILYKNFSIAMV